MFFGDDDYRAYLDLIAGAARRSGTEIWAYCAMPDHVHFIMTPSREDDLRATFAEAHRRYTARIHARLKVTGHLWQGRFSSTVMDERHLLAAARYLQMNPVKVGMVARAADWRWWSAAAYMAGKDDGVVTTGPLLVRIKDFPAFLEAAEDDVALRALQRSYSTGRPVGGDEWIRQLELDTGRVLAPARRGPKPKVTAPA